MRRELSPTPTLKWPRHNRVQITCNTSSANHLQHVCHLVQRDSSAFDRVGIAFILTLLFGLKPLTDEDDAVSLSHEIHLSSFSRTDVLSRLSIPLTSPLPRTGSRDCFPRCPRMIVKGGGGGGGVHHQGPREQHSSHHNPTALEGGGLEDVTSFTYLGSIADKQGGGGKGD